MAVPKGKAIFRFLLMATHKKANIERSIAILSNAKEKAKNGLPEMID